MGGSFEARRPESQRWDLGDVYCIICLPPYRFVLYVGFRGRLLHYTFANVSFYAIR